MAIFLILFGIAMIMLAWQNNQGSFVEQVGSDFSNGLLKWFGAVLVIGALGYIKALQPITRGVMGLILLVFLLKNGQGIFAQLQQAVTGNVGAQSGTTAPSTNATPATVSQSDIGSSGLGGLVGSVFGAGSALSASQESAAATGINNSEFSTFSQL